MLLKAICAFFILVYIHITFSQAPATCLEHLKDDWPKDGILRVEILKIRNEISTPPSHIKTKSVHKYPVLKSGCGETTALNATDNKSIIFDKSFILQQKFLMKQKDICSVLQNNNLKSEKLQNSESNQSSDQSIWTEEYSVEYALEYGLLRLSASARKKHKIPIKTVKLNPHTDSCFGDSFSRFILHEFLGYDDLLMASVKVLAEQEENKGYLR